MGMKKGQISPSQGFLLHYIVLLNIFPFQQESVSFKYSGNRRVEEA